ncbi:pyridoxal phosphate-dependent aminotransferase [Thiomicrorhabdus xiamenensis]|uniref:Aminotransferase class I/II-fold pyridoxal phosphate-dependent enzyme n=1 Tax=Thiomicrorhabdus xiamenensis TaxID=2739063 RepID=A0A7D4NQU1_9GAMM|nr:aminotransferase class I/II-fold pyridoxal phosphate-dependent enzyme [Thiomicrorhabdus xiamenensis]QKI89030.1 aminotransferase class I/II-fold pyridoxal phosphate-dependent enzyme [Thiomicrorhabdus xiamenensis]
MIEQPSCEHGGQVFAFAEHNVLALDQVLDFSASINPQTPKIDWERLQQQAQSELLHYPPERDNSLSPLQPLLAERFSLEVEQIFLSNGATQAIHQLFASLRPQHSVLFTPIYGEYQRAAQVYSKEVIEYRCCPSQWNKDSMPLPQNGLVVIVNPGTPQGTYLPPDKLLPLLEDAHRKNSWLLVDESFLPFIGFATELSLRQWLRRYPKLIVIQSLTKFYACPGVRIGALFSGSAQTKAFLPQLWPISSLDRLWLSQALQDPGHIFTTRHWLETVKPVFLQKLAQLSIVDKLYPGDVNFVLLRFTLPVSRVQQYLATEGILIRPVQSFGFSEYHARLAIKSPPDNIRLLKALNALSRLNMEKQYAGHDTL